MKSVKVQPAKGLMPSLQWAPLELLALDHSYQRSAETAASQKLIRSIATNWNWDMCLPLIAARRPGVVEFFVVDGQHRLAGAILRNKLLDQHDIRQLPCVIVAYDGAEAEAKAFVELNEQRRPLSALEVFRAALIAGDEEAVAIKTVVEAANLTIANHASTGQLQPGQICNIGGLRRSYRKWGCDITGRALSVLAQGWEGQRLRFAGTLFGGISGTIGQMVDADGNCQDDMLVMLLSETSQEDWRAEIMRHKVGHPNDNGDLAARAVITKAYREMMED